MGSPFDKVSADGTQGGTTRGKYVAAVLLTCLLGVVLAYNWMQGAPRQAGASPIGGAANLSPLDPTKAQGLPEQSMADVLAQLAHDPTAKLLRGKGVESTEFDEPPVNPFGLSPRWRSALVRPEHPRLVPQVSVEPATVATTSALSTYDMKQIKLQGIYRDGQGAHAIVNGVMVSPGMVVAGARIVEVTDDGMVCEPVGQGEGAQFTLQLKARKR